MKKPHILALAIGVIIAASAVYLLLKPKTHRSDTSPSSTVSSREEAVVSDPATQAGRYEDYSAAAVASEKTAQRLLFFHASWCPQCRELDASIKGTSLPENVVIFKVDYDNSQALRQKYGVTLQTTVVKIDIDENKVKSFVAYDQPNFEAVRKELLP